MKIYRRSVFPLLLVIGLLAAIFYMDHIPILQYLDEVITILLIPIVAFYGISEYRNVSKRIRTILSLYITIGLIGLVGTCVNNLQPNRFAVLLDMLTLSKIIVCPLGFYFLMNRNSGEEIIRILRIPAKLFLIIGFICSVVSQFVDLGMTEYSRNGIRSFYFVFGFQHLFSIIVLVALTVVLANKFDKTYIYISIIQMILTLKGPSIIWAVSVLFILYYFKKDRKKISFWVYVVITIVCVILGQFQIQNYLLNEIAPRRVLLNYGLKTAMTYFPLGAGFATYGSPVAAKYYSPLYMQYGFNNKYGMSAEDTAFLHDNYWPTILGQFGFCGLILSISIFVVFFFLIIKSNLQKELKAINLSSLLFIGVHSLGSAIFTTNATLLLMIVIIIVGKKNEAI